MKLSQTTNRQFVVNIGPKFDGHFEKYQKLLSFGNAVRRTFPRYLKNDLETSCVHLMKFEA